MKQFIRYILAIILTLGILPTQAQGDVSLPLSKTNSGHYAYPVKLNDSVTANALLESGIHALLIDSAFAVGNIDAIGIDFTPCSKTMNLGGKSYRITHTADTTLLLQSGTTYRGEIFLLANYATDYNVAMPIQNLHNSNGERLIELDLSGGVMKITDSKSQIGEWTELKINTNTYLNMPAIEGILKFNGVGYEASLEGNFNIDFGNPALLFLFEHRDRVKDFLNGNPEIKLQKGYDKKGNLIATVFVPDQLTLGSMYFKSPVVAITGFLPRFTTEGCIGLKFFQNTIVLFDFDNSVCYMQQK